MSATLLKIRLYGDDCLRQKCKPIDDVGPGERMLIAAMLETMNKAKGVGLAAPQVGVRRRIFIADVDDGPIAFINPEIIHKSGNVMMEEGCLSIPGINIDIERADQIVIQYTDEHNQKMEGVFSGLFARVIQHENDHLDGKMIVDYISDEQLIEIGPQLIELEQMHKQKQTKKK